MRSLGSGEMYLPLWCLLKKLPLSPKIVITLYQIYQTLRNLLLPKKEEKKKKKA